MYLAAYFCAGALAYLPFIMFLASAFFFLKARKDERYSVFAWPLAVIGLITLIWIAVDYAKVTC